MKPQAPFGLRMPEDIKTWVAERASENGRSVNSEIVQLLKVEMIRLCRRSKAPLKPISPE
jgi:hypothetical protein